MELGPEVCWMLTVIAHQEDAKRYSGSVTYWNEQLMTLCGFGSRKRLVTARNRAVDLGWLYYEQGGKSKPGRYWVLVPDGLAFSEDGPCDESDLSVRNGTANDLSVRNGTQNGTAKGRNGDRMRNSNSAPFNPSPIPNPFPKSASPKLIELIDGWNAIAGKCDLPKCELSTDLQEEWNAAQHDPDKRAALDDVPKFISAVSRSTFAHGKHWFTLQGLFSNTRSGESKLLKTINGAYENDNRNQKAGANRAGDVERYQESEWS